jgi:hypothetical protein
MQEEKCCTKKYETTKKRQGTHTEREIVHKLKGTFCGRIAIVVCDIHLDFERKKSTAVPNV